MAVPKKSKKRQAKTRFSKKCIWLRAVPKKSKKRQAKTLLLKIRNTPIALAALPGDFSIFSVPPLCQFSCEKPMIFEVLFKSLIFFRKKQLIFIDYR